MNEKCVLGQNGQFDLFVIDDAILFGVCKYVQRNGTIRYTIFRIHIYLQDPRVKLNVAGLDYTLTSYILTYTKKIASSMTKRSN